MNWTDLPTRNLVIGLLAGFAWGVALAILFLGHCWA